MEAGRVSGCKDGGTLDTRANGSASGARKLQGRIGKCGTACSAARAVATPACFPVSAVSFHCAGIAAIALRFEQFGDHFLTCLDT